MERQTGKSSRPLPPPPPSTIGRTSNSLAEKTKTKASTQGNRAAAKSNKPKRSSGQPSLEYLVKKAYDEGYSDIHLGVGEVPRMRDRGNMALTEYPKTDRNTFIS